MQHHIIMFDTENILVTMINFIFCWRKIMHNFLSMQEKNDLFYIYPIGIIGIKSFYYFVFNGFTFFSNRFSLNKISDKLVFDKILILASLTSNTTFLKPQISSLTHSAQGS